MPNCPRCIKGNLVTDSEAFTGYSCLACGFEPKPEGWTPPTWSPEIAFRVEREVDLSIFEL